MTANVFANGREVSAKKDGNKSAAAMPDVCLSPPSPPAGPIPIPYPNFAMGSDTSGGTKTVKIKGAEAGIKNKSNYKSSKGNEAATRSFGANVITHQISGKMYHAAWSMDVKFEGKNAIRMLDLTTHNHGSTPPGGAVTMNLGAFKVAPPIANCEELKNDTDKEAKAKKGEQEDGVTFATAQFDDGSQGLRAKSSSSMSAVKNQDGIAKGKKTGRKFDATGMCEEGEAKLPKDKDKGTKYVDYGRSDNQGPMCHAESRLMEELFSVKGPKPGGSVTFDIAWKDGDGEMDNVPCSQCEKMLCAATECDLQIFVCKEGKAEELDCKK